MATDAISPATLTDSLPKHQKRPSLIIHISEAEFEDEGNFYLKFEASFWGKPADKAPRTDVSTPPTRHPIFRPDTFSFNIPEGTSEDVPSEKNNSVKVVISAIRVEKTKDGGATINKIGSHTFKSRDLRLLEGKKTEVQTTLLSDTVPGFPAKPVGQIRLILSLDLDSDHEDFVASAAAQPNGPRISLWNRKNEVDEVQERITKKDEKYSMFINEHTKTDGQKVVVFIHFIYNLPPLTNLGNGQISLPSPFISIKTAKEAATNIRAKLVTNTAKPGTAASYAEKFIIKFEQPYTSQNPSEIPEIFISILDETSKRYIAKFNIPIAAIHFPSHRQVNLVLRSVSTVHKEITPCLRISVRNEDCSIGSKRLLQREYSRAMIFLEAYLKGVNKALPVDARYIAALRISHHSADYAAKMTALQSRFQKSCPTSFPQLQPAAQLDFDSNGTMISDYPLSKDAPIPYLIYDKTQQSSSKLSKGDSLYYQMTLATSFTSTPAWNEHFLFFIDLASFSHDTALIIELYKDPQLSESSSKTAPPAIDDIMAYAIVPLGDFSIISNTETQLVVNVDDIALTFIGQYENMSGTDNITLSIDFKVPENWGTLKTDSVKAKYVPKVQKTSIEGSIEQLLEMVKQEREVELNAVASAAEEPLESKKMIFTYADVEQRQRLIDRLLQELEGRANAIQKIGQDLVLCKERNTKLEEKTLMLEDKLRESEIRTTKLLNTVDIQDIPRDELEKRYSSMAQRLQNEIIAKRELSVKLEIAQLAQIERNDIEKKYLEMQQAHLAQQQKLQELQGGNNVISHYKATIEKQEHVIAKLGSYLKEKMPETVQRKIDDAINSNNTEDVEINLYRVLADENALLKRQILELETTKDVSNQLSTSNKMLSISSSSFSDSQYLEVLMRAETSETRVSVLEAELAKNARKFACQLADMQKKLTERSSQQRTPEYSILKDIKPENIVRRRQVSWSRDSQSPPGGKAASAKPVPSHRSHPQLPQTHPLKQRLSKRESDLYF